METETTVFKLVTSRGVTHMSFLDKCKAVDHYHSMVNKHGSAMPKLQLIEQTITIKEKQIELEAIASEGTGTALLEESDYSKDLRRI